MSVVEIVIASVVVLLLLVVVVGFCVEEARQSRMKVRAGYNEGVQAARRIEAKARELEQQIYAEAMRHRAEPESSRDQP